ncbi:MAG: tetratricopeptide repeat protein [Candidatus Eremiobacteraeota bacterium]|nr:tetratricopeptide repeat protein [Candidatus Eremiobacteraeota bacterium]
MGSLFKSKPSKPAVPQLDPLPYMERAESVQKAAALYCELLREMGGYDQAPADKFEAVVVPALIAASRFGVPLVPPEVAPTMNMLLKDQMKRLPAAQECYQAVMNYIDQHPDSRIDAGLAQAFTGWVNQKLGQQAEVGLGEAIADFRVKFWQDLLPTQGPLAPRAAEAFRSGRVEDALILSEQAIAAGEGIAWNIKLNALDALGRWDQILACYAQAEQAMPAQTGVQKAILPCLGRAYRAAGREEELALVFEKLMAIDPLDGLALATSLVTRAAPPSQPFQARPQEGAGFGSWWPAEPTTSKSHDPETGELHQFSCPFKSGAMVVQLTLYPDSIDLGRAGEEAHLGLLEMEKAAMEQHGNYTGNLNPRQLQVDGRLGLEFVGVNRSRFLASRMYVDGPGQRLVRCLVEVLHADAYRPEVRGFLDSFGFG